ncbi:hypothetical protein LZ32DRAFT_621920 [Colletotrichum eremochloae]|nr:hypothetical protein LZ32DRAFT_621920 [Colletotrichum eremochloae]
MRSFGLLSVAIFALVSQAAAQQTCKEREKGCIPQACDSFSAADLCFKARGEVGGDCRTEIINEDTSNAKRISNPEDVAGARVASVTSMRWTGLGILDPRWASQSKCHPMWL